MKRSFHIPIAGLVATASLVSPPAGAQQPERPLLVAAERINAVTPQAVARQTIRLGTYNAASKQFVWALEPGYSSNVPGYKTQEEGGPAAPRYYVTVNSYTVAYEIEIANKPANFSLALVYSGPNGQTISRPASIAGSIATVDVSPPSSGQHTIQINQAGTPSPLRFFPRLADQLGAFVVPYLLVSIIYEPPGKGSKATYSITTTAGSSLTLGLSRSSGFVTEPATTDTLMEVFNKVVGLYLEKAWGKPGEFVAGVLEGIGGIQTNTVQFIIDTTVSSSTTKGHVFSLTEGWATRPDDEFSYPGNGDLFVILRDVLFVYVAYQGKIYMAPVAYSIDRGLIRSELPPDVAPGYVSLDPHFRTKAGGPVIGEQGGRMHSVATMTPTSASAYPAGDARRFRRRPSQPCEKHGTKILEITSTDYQITSATRAITQTKLERATGLVAMATGSSGTTTTSVTYSSTTENYTSTSVAPSIEVACEGEAFEIEVFFDNLFGTFFTRRGAPLATYAAVTGEATDAQGRPRPNEIVTLTIGDRSYRVRSDATGSFQFPFSSIPSGTGTLRVGNQAYRMSYAGSPKRITLRGNTATEDATAPTSQVPVGVQIPGEERAGKPVGRPTAQPTTRPGRP